MSNQITTLTATTPAAAYASQTSVSPATTQNQKSKSRFHGKQTGARTGSTSNKPNQSNRNAKRARWAKKNRPVAKPIAQKGPAREYVCVCHGEPARKPRAGTKVSMKDPETGKMKDRPLGLGKWRCATTGKVAKVAPRAPKPKELTQQGSMGGLKIDPYPGKLQTPVLAFEVTDVQTPVGS